MPPEEHLVPRFAAEPPQELLPYGRRAEQLHEEFLAACLLLDDDLGAPGAPVWFPDRTWAGRTYVPVTCRTERGLELFGAVSYAPAVEQGQTEDHFRATADWTEETAEANPDWSIDLCEEVIGGWRGEAGKVAAMTLIWGTPLVDRGAIVTAELAGLTVDQCVLVENRFTLVAPDDYRGDTLEVAVYDAGGRELGREALWAGEEDADDEEGA
ncbi:hypothetical protein FSW04_03290 [Baekduia soli]|uniref:Uncharacterized protein n=1 Tax=Baekduia soli TaxID=496014 RepID=A0A5B8U108_9ACTN|nr:hypothetical protein [Baekduia soli]QEC46703.1 hypothetical protein FSW04_03290 [Baekduia soli]